MHRVAQVIEHLTNFPGYGMILGPVLPSTRRQSGPTSSQRRPVSSPNRIPVAATWASSPSTPATAKNWRGHFSGKRSFAPSWSECPVWRQATCGEVNTTHADQTLYQLYGGFHVGQALVQDPVGCLRDGYANVVSIQRQGRVVPGRDGGVLRRGRRLPSAGIAR